MMFECLEAKNSNCNRVHIIDEDEKSISLSGERIEQTIVKMGAKLFILDPLQALQVYLGGVDMHRDCRDSKWSTEHYRAREVGIIYKATKKHFDVLGLENFQGWIYSNW